MLATPTKAQLTDLAYLVQQPRWQGIEQIIEAEIAATVDRMVHNTDVAVIHEARGRIKVLQEFQSLAREASSTLEKQGLKVPL